MAAYQTLIRYQEEWNKALAQRDKEALLGAMKFVQREYISHPHGRLTSQDWMVDPVGELRRSVSLEGINPVGLKKGELASIMARKSREWRKKNEEELQQRVEALERGEIAPDTVRYMIYALDTFVW